MAIIFVFVASLCVKTFADPCPSPCICRPQGQVYCNGTGIKEIPKGIPKDTTLLDIGDNPITTISKDALYGMENLISLDMSGMSLRENGIEAGALDLPNLTDIDISYTSLRSIPTTLPKKMNTFRMIQCNIETVLSECFQNYPNIAYLDLSNNAITKIQANAFDPLVNLDTLYIGFNKLQDISLPDGVFSKCSKIRSIDLRFNRLENILQDLPNTIQHLCYVGNSIQTLHSYAFKDQTNLQTLAFWQGNVKTIQDNAFYGLSQLTLLDFMQDRISSTLTNSTFTGLSNINTLYMDLNEISQIETGALYPLRNVTSLWLQSNQLKTLQPEVLNTTYLTKLNTLFIDDNPWYCDCHLRWLREKVNNASYVIQDPHLIKCSGPPSVAGKAWDVLKPEDFICNERD